MKKLCVIFSAAAIVLSDVMCAVTAYSYRSMLCAAAHGGASAPASVALLGAIPFAVGLLLCATAAWWFHRKAKG